MNKKDIYHRIFVTDFGRLSKLDAWLPSEKAGRFIPKGRDHKLHEDREVAFQQFIQCVGYLFVVGMAFKFEHKQYVLMELGCDSQYGIIAISDHRGGVVRIDTGESWTYDEIIKNARKLLDSLES